MASIINNIPTSNPYRQAAVSEIQHLNNSAPNPGIATTSATGADGQRFQQLMAQLPPEGQDWSTATNILANTDYVQQAELSAEGQTAVRSAQSQMQNEHGVEITLEMAATQVLINDLTSRLAQATAENEAGSAALQAQAQQLQTELSEQIYTLKAPQRAEAELRQLQNRLQTLLDSLGITREALEAMQTDLGNGEVAVADLLAGETTEAGELNILITVAERERAKNAQPQQSPADLRAQTQAVDEFLNTVSPEQQQQWSQRLGYSVELKPFLLSGIQQTGAPLTVDKVNRAIDRIWPDLPAVKPVRLDGPTNLREGEQYEISLLKNPEKGVELLSTQQLADYALHRLFQSFRQTSSQPGAFHVRVMDYDKQEVSAFQVYWNLSEGGIGTTYMTPQGEMLTSESGAVMGAQLPLPNVRIASGLIYESPQTVPLDVILNWHDSDYTGLDPGMVRPYVKKLLVSAGDSELYQLPTNRRIAELSESLRALVEQSPVFWGRQTDKALTPAQERRLTIANKARQAQEFVFTNSYPVLALRRASQREREFEANQPLPMTPAEWRSAGVQNTVLDLVEAKFPQRIEQLQNRISSARNVGEIRHFEAKLKDVYMRIIPRIKPHDQLPMLNTRIDPFVNQGIANLIARGVSFWGANLKGTDLSGLDLRNTNIEYIKHDENTNWSGTLLTEWQISELGLDRDLFEPVDDSLPSTDVPLGTTIISYMGIDTGDGVGNTNGPTAYLPNNSGSYDFSSFTVSSRFNFQNPNGLIDFNNDAQSGHDGSGNNSNKALTAVAGDAPEPEQAFKVINGQVVVGDTVLLPELDLGNGVARPGENILGIPVGLRELPEPAGRNTAEIPVADTTAETQPSSQQGGVTWGGRLGSPTDAEQARQRMEEIFGKGWSQGVRPDLFPTPIDSRIPGFGEGMPQPSLDDYNTGWGLPAARIHIENETFPEKDEQLENILRPHGEAGPTFIFPPVGDNEHLPEIPETMQQAINQALPALQKITYVQYKRLNPTDRQNILTRAAEYQILPADIKANTSLIQYADSTKTSQSQRIQMLGEQHRQNLHSSQLLLSNALSGLNDSTIQLIDTRINALQSSTIALNKNTQLLNQSNAERQKALATPSSDPITAAFIKPNIDSDKTPPTSDSTPNTEAVTQATAIPRFIVINTASGPRLAENLPNGQTQMLPFLIPGDTPITRQDRNGAWLNVPDAYAIGAKNLLDTLFLQGAVKMLNKGGPVQIPGAQSVPTTPTAIPRLAY